MFKKFEFVKYIFGLMLVLNNNFVFSANYIDLKDEDIPEVKECVEKFKIMMSPSNNEVSWSCLSIFVGIKLFKVASVIKKEIKGLPANSAKIAVASKRAGDAEEIAKILFALRDVTSPITVSDSLDEYENHPLFQLIQQDQRITSLSKVARRDLLLRSMELNCKVSCDFVEKFYKKDIVKFIKDFEQNKIDQKKFLSDFTNVAKFFCCENLINSENFNLNVLVATFKKDESCSRIFEDSKRKQEENKNKKDL